MGVSFCSECKDKTCLKTKKPCNQVEALLRSEGIYSSDWIRPMMPSNKRSDGGSVWREIPFSSLNVDEGDGKDPLMSDAT